MRCKEYIKYLSPYMDSELDAKTCVEIADHLAICQGCRKRFAQEQEVERLLVERLKDGRMPEHMWKAIQTSVGAHDYAPGYAARSSIVLRWLVPAIATAVMAIGLSVFFFWVKAPEDRDLVLVLQGVHERYLRDEIAVARDVVWPEDFRQMSLLGWMPQSGNIGGHDVKLLSGRPYYLKDVEVAFLEYRCCGEPVLVFILRKEDLDNFPQTKDLLERNRGLANIALEDTNLVMIDVGEAVVYGISSHELNTLLKAFERV
ncbi:MAG: anti-sigma factor family protein [Candidatus Brocadiales bacterium]